MRADERERLEALHEYGVVDAPADDELQAVVRVAAMVAGVPTATVSIAPDLPVLPGDPTLLWQLLQNLIGNAVKYRDPARPAHIAVAARRRDTDWLVTVADNGIGIPAEQRDRVFDMFAQVEPGGTHHGYGVGLTTCQRIVERHGGRIWVEPTPGGGATVSLTLPGA